MDVISDIPEARFLNILGTNYSRVKHELLHKTRFSCPFIFCSGSPRSNTLMVACTNVTMDVEARAMITEDCVNGTWFEDDFNNGRTNYSHLTKIYWEMRDVADRRVQGIDYERDITIYNSTK